MRPAHTPSRQAASPLANRIGDDATPDQIAAAFGAVWLELDAILSPIIGPRGVAALGQRSLHLASEAYPWLAAGRPGGQAPFDPVLLAPLLADRSRSEAMAATSTFLHTFHETLSRLIGASLCERLLQSVWDATKATPLKSPPSQDTTT